MKKILSIDGGGIRGIIPGVLLVALEHKLKKVSGNQQASISDYFDFFAGTSTGGILTSLLLCPSEADPTKPRFTAEEALGLYVKHGEDIFKSSFWRQLKSRFGLSSERYNSAVLEEVLQHYFNETKLSELLKPCIISAYNIELRKTHFFRQHAAIDRGPVRDFYLKDVCRATSAAPTYFSVAKVYSLADVRYPLLDGGVFATNPALSGLIEVTRAYNQTKINDIFLLSLGTGISKRSYDYDYFKKKTAMKIVPALIDIMMSGVAETSDFFLEQLFYSAGKHDHYIRIEPQNLQSIQEALDAASSSNIKKLIALGDRTASENDEALHKIAEFLVEEDQRGKKSSPFDFLRGK